MCESKSFESKQDLRRILLSDTTNRIFFQFALIYFLYDQGPNNTVWALRDKKQFNYSERIF